MASGTGGPPPDAIDRQAPRRGIETGGSRFERAAGMSAERFGIIGPGDVGGKASGLARLSESLERSFPGGIYEGVRVSIPRMTVLATGVFDEFMRSNRLDPGELAGLEDDRIAHRFQKAELPATVVGDLLGLIGSIREPLAVRSSSLLEDALREPFAGVYATKMIPNNQPEAEVRFRRLVEAIKYIYASTYFEAARRYFRAVGRDLRQERMAVIIQEVVGYRYGQRYYPTVSGVARSVNFYPTGNARPEEGVVTLALGLGKTIVDGGRAWSFSPAFPKAPPPLATPAELLKNTQNRFWSVSMGTPKEYDPTRETEYLYEGTLEEAEADGALEYLCSTYDPASDRFVMGAYAPGPRLLDFSPLLKGRILALDELLRKLLDTASERVGEAVEIEFALSFDPRRKRESRLGFLQVRPMVAASDGAPVDLERTGGRRPLLSADRALGNGVFEGLQDILYVEPETFRAEATREIAEQVGRMNSVLLEEGTPYVLIGFGRWGSADPWLGIPVRFSQISGAAVLVEAALPAMNPDPSQGSHFFHNLSGLGVLYLSVARPDPQAVDWLWLGRQPTVSQTEHLRHVRCKTPVAVMVDGRSGRGLILE
jgi:hypothetical protein